MNLWPRSYYFIRKIVRISALELVVDIIAKPLKFQECAIFFDLIKLMSIFTAAFLKQKN